MDAADIDSALEATLDIDGSFLKAGKLKGQKRGAEIGSEDAAAIGEARGKSIGLELGMYSGFVNGILVMKVSQDSLIPENVISTGKKLKELIDAFPINEPLSENSYSKLLTIRAKIKVLSSRIGFSPGFPDSHLNENTALLTTSSELF
uniref:Essential protein Yae1 N-terminal domain-containing protein n=1 Tax=Aplanochytrium stocchinoi TaxID=215587 RepID=A0A7S3LHM3_9STRA|mmetsp:Transcript_4414/g.5575  ORF Transcript_4414/g.5575 Transcript_4414/m.5575 type:complete len:148 (+) Transcript_4414:469-912(+)|eukprot:CAMPEP_0204833106 /NCGR_PEP_ID=MMETSP1346-20131115/15655_1 /ASSEMBLY_ACC=CAM_ASM_000771 /TAXON_ID=215587 /ORGANISM="Aplanochytrium stocchinoi, Strain GSBS06" /LENGTH=147 /DNA_ID=CAMNT_0051965371 /DNA_START=65 /DNA_END=508 /DNA_ORIENTATION=-